MFSIVELLAWVPGLVHLIFLLVLLVMTLTKVRDFGTPALLLAVALGLMLIGNLASLIAPAFVVRALSASQAVVVLRALSLLYTVIFVVANIFIFGAVFRDRKPVLNGAHTSIPSATNDDVNPYRS